jgi:hypothetical protein
MNALYIVFIYYVEDVKLILIVCISLSSEICLMQHKIVYKNMVNLTINKLTITEK